MTFISQKFEGKEVQDQGSFKFLSIQNRGTHSRLYVEDSKSLKNCCV